jgi:hypothetical protein
LDEGGRTGFLGNGEKEVKGRTRGALGGGRRRDAEGDGERWRETEGDRGREMEGDGGRWRETAGDGRRRRETEGKGGRWREMEGDRGREAEGDGGWVGRTKLACDLKDSQSMV